jgi:hypothetical protein
MSVKGGPNTVTSGLVLELDAGNIKSYPGTGTTWFDKSGNAYNGTLINGPTFNTGSLGSIVFDGVDDYVLANLTPLGLNVQGPYTFNCYIKYNTSSGGVRNPITLSNTGSSSFQFGYIAGNPVVWKYGGSVLTTFTPPAVNTVHYMTCTVTTASVDVYINGVLNATVSSPSLQTGNLDSLLCSAYWASGIINTTSVFSGNIYNISLYNKILTPVEVLQNYNATKTRFGL